ncbi:MAG: hypothetical protein LBJ67_07305 [Planctomycetaceae bacterium]|jgi:hypothetical protein|nr:hypothetical protein [Planctomycetaceae bacterium]
MPRQNKNFSQNDSTDDFVWGELKSTFNIYVFRGQLGLAFWISETPVTSDYEHPIVRTPTV